MELERHREQAATLPASKEINPDVFGNHSRYAKNWINGPTHEIRQQHIPGYTGHCRGLVNKDFMSKSYAKVTAELFANQHPMGTNGDGVTRFTATQRATFKPQNFRRWGKLVFENRCNSFSRLAIHGSAEGLQRLLEVCKRQLPTKKVRL